MNTLLLDLGRIALVGIGATVVMDLWLALLRRLGVPTLDFALLGRWAGHLARGRLRHGLLAAIVGTAWLQSPTVLPALAVGAATVAAPLFVMQPSMGAGIASSRTAAPLTNCLRSLANHTVFGAGLYVAAATIQLVAA
jgi:Protein of unknown function (DUF2938)